ncbi:hypothetical protein B0H19DRAFT_1072389 [Mycena capillaripes]|nr:hypothetical protein B0H19DRAFT_1072389 [Mycena capillaripes]
MPRSRTAAGTHTEQCRFRLVLVIFALMMRLCALISNWHRWRHIEFSIDMTSDSWMQSYLEQGIKSRKVLRRSKIGTAVHLVEFWRYIDSSSTSPYTIRTSLQASDKRRDGRQTPPPDASNSGGDPGGSSHILALKQQRAKATWRRYHRLPRTALREGVKLRDGDSGYAVLQIGASPRHMRGYSVHRTPQHRDDRCQYIWRYTIPFVGVQTSLGIYICAILTTLLDHIDGHQTVRNTHTVPSDPLPVRYLVSTRGLFNAPRRRTQEYTGYSNPAENWPGLFPSMVKAVYRIMRQLRSEAPLNAVSLGDVPSCDTPQI